jgi:hypothetical protein
MVAAAETEPIGKRIGIGAACVCFVNSPKAPWIHLHLGIPRRGVNQSKVLRLAEYALGCSSVKPGERQWDRLEKGFF